MKGREFGPVAVEGRRLPLFLPLLTPSPGYSQLWEYSQPWEGSFSLAELIPAASSLRFSIPEEFSERGAANRTQILGAADAEP